MSLFIGSLVFEPIPAYVKMMFDERLGILLGSLVSGVAVFAVFSRTLPASAAAGDRI